MDRHEYSWICMDMQGYAWIGMDMHGWICMDMHGYACICRDMQGYARMCMDTHGYTLHMYVCADVRAPVRAVPASGSCYFGRAYAYVCVRVRGHLCKEIQHGIQPTYVEE